MPLDDALQTARSTRRNLLMAHRRLLTGALALSLMLMVAGAAGVGLFLIERIEGEISVQAFEDVILSWGHWGVLASIGLMVLHSFVPFPAELVALANGMLYGPLWGTVVTWTGAMLGAFLAFGLSRALGRPFVKAMVAQRKLQMLDDWAEQHAAPTMLAARLLPVISFNLVNYAAGLMRVSWWTFAWTTGLGILPLTILTAAMGDQVGKIAWPWWLLVLTSIGLLLFIATRWLQARITPAGKPGTARAVGQRSGGQGRP